MAKADGRQQGVDGSGELAVFDMNTCRALLDGRLAGVTRRQAV